MALIEWFVRNPVKVSVAVLMVALFGVIGVFRMPMQLTPEVNVPTITVETRWRGASPQEIEQEVQSVNGIKEIRSTSTEGVSTVVIEFDPNVSIEEAYQKVRDKVDIAKTDLPTDVEEPRVDEIDFSEFPILTINLASE